MKTAQEYFIQLIDDLANVKEGKMFGFICMKTANGKAAAMFWKDNLIVKLQDKVLEDALKLNNAKLFKPMEGKLIKDRVQIPFEHKVQWKTFTKISAEKVQSMVKKSPAKKKKDYVAVLNINQI